MSAARDEEFLRAALDPARSVVVDACAGSGKTWLLVSRIIRLLLAGVPPSEILAITFTRKAAQEMRARLVEWLRLLATAPDEDVLQFLRQRAIADAGLPNALARARGLFESTLVAQPGITIDTFHGWFLQLLKRAPFSAAAGSAPADFTLEEKVSLLLDEAWDLFGESLRQPENAALAKNFGELSADLGYTRLKHLFSRFLLKRAEWWTYTRSRPDPVAFALAELEKTLAVDADGDPLRMVVEDSGFARTLEALAALQSGNGDTGAGFADDVAGALAEQGAPLRFQRLYAIFFTMQDGLRQKIEKLFRSQPADVLERYAGVCGRLATARDALAELQVFRLHQRALPCVAHLLDVFQQLKRARQIIDFTDIEWHAFNLLSDSDDAAFMHAKLDARYRHILLDEFQDTNPLQWQALRAWLDAYGGDAGRPTVFLVGDPKQSIYRFRRAEPRLFEVAAATLATEYGATRLVTSETRRCAPAIVEVVNAAFDGPQGYADFPRHVSRTADEPARPGRVEVLPLARHPESAAAVPAQEWRNPLGEPLREQQDLRRSREAAALAARIREMVGNWEVPGRNGGRPARYSDVMILKRTRTNLAVYEHALRAQGIPFVTTRHGGLLGTLEAADLCALIGVLIAPFDDLKLAHALKSPLFACSDDDLIRLARRAGSDADAGADSWWQRLQALASDAAPQPATPALARAARLLARWQAEADTRPVHDLLDTIYHEGQVIARYCAACPLPVAGQVTANLNRFLELALELDSGRYPSLPRFVAELERLRGVPDQESPDEGQEAAADDAADEGDDVLAEAGAGTLDAVRILTIHGAKGLEAPVVWLIDARERSRSESNDALIDWPPESAAPRHFSLFTVGAARGGRRDALFQTQAGLAERERLNLLYVAATRAQRYFFVSGIDSKRTAGGDSAYDRIAAAVTSIAQGAQVVGDIAIAGATATHGPGDGDGGRRAAVFPSPAGAAHGIGARIDLGAAANSAAARVGKLLHLMLEHGSAQSGTRTGPEAVDALRRLLDIAEAEFTPLWAQAQAILGAPPLRRFFDPAGYRRAENELEAISASGLRRIDRLVEFDDEVWILDYKSGDESGREAWQAQLADYRALIGPMFPGKRMRSAIVRGDGILEESGS